MDSFGGGLITSTLVSYWFFQRFDLSLDVIGFIFFASRLLAAVSFMVATKIAERIGLINTMVYSHLPASIALIFIPYMPTLLTSVALYVGRSLLASMDVPCRQSYIMAAVEPEERTRVSGLINLPRNFAQALSPMFAGVLMQFAGLSFPFLIGGAIKSTYDILLYITFRDIKPSKKKNKTKQ
jgi:MFS family permease